MKHDKKYSLLLWNLPRTHWAYRTLAFFLLAFFIFYPSSNNPWFQQGERVSIGEDGHIILFQRGLQLLVILEEEAPPLTAVEAFIMERFGSDAVLTPTDENWIYTIETGAKP